MHFAVIAWDGPDGATARAAALEAHFSYIEAISDVLAVAGPLKDANDVMIGSLLVLSCDSADAAEGIFKADPYFKAGVWARWHIHPFLAAAGQWVGGKIW